MIIYYKFLLNMDLEMVIMDCKKNQSLPLGQIKTESSPDVTFNANSHSLDKCCKQTTAQGNFYLFNLYATDFTDKATLLKYI